ncbi:late embryogenesis abundant protein B19.4-like [Pistacia vera]|uniref:late embryogenesis abundant protein B19.4-like n=1 Tax=Pistacia vera TaxID=55513 RepID=UPI00126314D8|nr:late embryogenesis abundant protein B19.4-like [Pistacia vera]
MASGRQREEHDASARQGESGGTGDNNLQLHRGGQTKGEHLWVPGYQESRGHQHQGQQKKEQHGTESNKEMGHGGAGEAGEVNQGIDIDESTG